jgi:hypothetical protein
LRDSAVFFFLFFLTAGQPLCDKPKIKGVVHLKKIKNQRNCRNGSASATGVNTVFDNGITKRVPCGSRGSFPSPQLRVVSASARQIPGYLDIFGFCGERIDGRPDAEVGLDYGLNCASFLVKCNLYPGHTAN